MQSSKTSRFAHSLIHHPRKFVLVLIALSFGLLLLALRGSLWAIEPETAEIRRLHEENGRLREETRKLREVTRKLQEEIGALQERLQKCEVSALDLGAEITRRSGIPELEKRQGEMSNAAQKIMIKELQDQNRDLDSKRTQLQGELQDYVQEISKMEEEHENQIKEYKRTIENLNENVKQNHYWTNHASNLELTQSKCRRNSYEKQEYLWYILLFVLGCFLGCCSKCCEC